MHHPVSSRLLGLALILICGGTLLGCPGGMSGTLKEQLQRSTMMYFDGIRWKKFSQAAVVIPPEKRLDFIQSRESSQDTFFVTSCEVKSVNLDDDKEEARVEVVYQWYKLPSVTIKTTRLEQTWEFNDQWYLKEQRELKDQEKAPEEPITDLL